MAWTLFFKIISIVYALYYSVIVIFDLSDFNKKNNRSDRKLHEGYVVDTSYLNALPKSDIVPIKASSIVSLHTTMNKNNYSTQKNSSEIAFNESDAFEEILPVTEGVNLEDIDISLDVQDDAQTIESLFAEIQTEIETISTDIFSKYE